MQHIVHVFIGNNLSRFSELFASTFRRNHVNIEQSLFTSLSLTTDGEGLITLTPDKDGDTADVVTISTEERSTHIINYFEDIYRRKVTVAHPGNRSIIVVLWVQLFDTHIFEVISEFISALIGTEFNLNIEIIGFTHQAVDCFIPDPLERKSPGEYKRIFDTNISKLLPLRQSISAFKLISNRNMENLSLDLNEESLARIGSEYAALCCEHYLSIHPTVIDTAQYPLESFGISSIIFDVEYYEKYLQNKVVIDKLQEQKIEHREYNINTLAESTNPILQEVLKEIRDFYNSKAINAQAQLSLDGEVLPSAVVAKIDDDVKAITDKLKQKIDTLLDLKQINIFEAEALLSLILGDDCSMFESSAVVAEETLIDDIIDESAQFFTSLDPLNSVLTDVSQKEIKTLRTEMRNIAVANRNREARLEALDISINPAEKQQNHLYGDKYKFGGIEYKVNLNIDTEPLETTYEPHEVTDESVDLRNIFLPIRNQGNQGSCAAFAVSSVIEAQIQAKKHRYSPAFLYWVARNNLKTADTDSGATMYAVIRGAVEKGVCKEESMPYNSDIYTLQPSDSAIEEALQCRIIAAKSVEPKLHAIKSALSDGYPVIAAIQIFDSFSETHSGFIPHPSVAELKKAGSDNLHAYHGMVICGFSDKDKVLVVRNSWGTDFGDNGYCYIPYSYAQKYIKQACVITEISSSENNMAITKDCINFNLADNNVEAAILQNLIHEDSIKLHEMGQESTALKKDWTENIAILGNVNNQTQIINSAKKECQDRINGENQKIKELQSSMPEKIRSYKTSLIKSILIAGGITLASCITTAFLYNSSISWCISLLCILIFLSLIVRYNFKWKKYRQDCRDEIHQHANTISHLQERKRRIDINAHIHGTIIKETGNYRMQLYSRLNMIKDFNSDCIDYYEKVKKEHSQMSPAIPYPFLCILNNSRLDRYYEDWKDKMLSSFSLDSVLYRYSDGVTLSDIIRSDESLKAAIMRGLKNFSMKEYISVENQHRWSFLPDSTNLSELIPELDRRAVPFCPYHKEWDNTIEKYLFIKDIRLEDMKIVNTHFTQTPSPVSSINPYSISTLNIVRYSLHSMT